MKITLSIADLRRAWSIVSPLASSSSVTPILSCVKLRATSFGSVMIGATDSRCSLVVEVRDDIKPDTPIPTNYVNEIRSLAIPADDFSKILGTLGDSGGITLESSGSESSHDKLLITSGRSQWDRNLMDINIYPQFFGMMISSRFCFDSIVFARALDRITPVLKSASFQAISLEHQAHEGVDEGESNNGVGSLVAYDGRRFVVQLFPLEYFRGLTPTSAPMPLIPAAAIKPLTALLRLGNPLHVGWDRNHIRFASGPAVLAISLESAKFFDWRRFPRPGSDYPIRFVADSFVSAIRQAQLNAKDSRRLHLDFSENQVSMRSEDEKGRSRTSLPVSYAGPAFSIIFQADTLADSLEPLRDAEVVAHLLGGIEPTVGWFRSVGSDWEAVVMPMGGI